MTTRLETQLRAQGIRSDEVLRAMARVPRVEFLPRESRTRSDEDEALPIGCGQTISQPYIVALMTQSLETSPEDHILEVGTGSGYQAAVLSHLVSRIDTVEILPELAQRAAETLLRLDCRNVVIHQGDGALGWPKGAPYDAILVTCAPVEIPPDLLAQVRDGGRIILPVGKSGTVQKLIRLTREGEAFHREELLDVRFVPLTREPDSRSPGGKDHS